MHACSVLPEFDALYVTHIRYKLGLLPAVEEAVEIARRSGCRLHLSHLKPQSPDQIEPLLELLDQARREVDEAVAEPVEHPVYPDVEQHPTVAAVFGTEEALRRSACHLSTPVVTNRL